MYLNTSGRMFDQKIMQGIEDLLKTEYNITITNKLKLLVVTKLIKEELSFAETFT